MITELKMFNNALFISEQHVVPWIDCGCSYAIYMIRSKWSLPFVTHMLSIMNSYFTVILGIQWANICFNEKRYIIVLKHYCMTYIEGVVTWKTNTSSLRNKTPTDTREVWHTW